MAENNSKGLCAECGNQLEGQTYEMVKYIDGEGAIIVHVCQGCELKRIDKRIKDREYIITVAQADIKDLKKRKTKVENNEAEFSQ